MNDAVLTRLRDIIQDDVGRRGLRTDPTANLINAWPDDFSAACRSLANHPAPRLGVVTGFIIPTATPVAGETDGPLGALFLARALVPLGISVSIATDDFCIAALQAGLAECDLTEQTPLVTLPTPAEAREMTAVEYRRHFEKQPGGSALTHLLAIERVGPSHTHGAVPPNERDRCHTMRGRDITDLMSPAHFLFETAGNITTIGIGDGGNEIGMGKIPWDVVNRNIAAGGLVACRIPTNHLIVCGVSNWGAYALAAGIAHLRNTKLDPALVDPLREQSILDVMVKAGPLVDGVTGQPTATVDGLTWEQYSAILSAVGRVS